MSTRRFALVAGGGTAGHTIPALAVARALAVDRSAEDVELVGSNRGLDSGLLAGVEFPVSLLGGRGFVRSRSRRATVANFGALVGLLSALLESFVLVIRRRPAVVVAVGGYASVAPSVAAWVFGIPVVVLNVDAVPGAANRFVARFAKACAVAYPGTDIKNAVVTGPPVRPEVVAMRDRAVSDACARTRLGLPAGALVIAAFGGSLGAGRLNEAVIALADRWSGRSGLAIYHVVGARNADWAATAARELSLGSDPDGLVYVQVAYEDHMELVYTACDVAVCRAGANTVAELTVTGTPAVLVPLPGAPGDHQNANADVLAKVGAAVVVQDGDLDVERLSEELERLVADPARLEAMAVAARGLGRPDAAQAVAALAAGHARRWEPGS